MMNVDLDEESGRFAAREVLGATIKPWVLARTLDEVREIFDRHGVQWGLYQTFTQLVQDDPRVSTENPMFSEVHQPRIGTYLMPGSPLVFSRAERLTAVRAPVLGEHTDEVLAGVLGLSDTEIGHLHDEGVVFSDRLPVGPRASTRQFTASADGGARARSGTHTRTKTVSDLFE